ncbi:MAG TPA: SMC-Scp complex subunit ScpB [Oligoflexia bacterium]|nr:SMC-Scp complex subunit ScpB [Oligoflexia bacterium]HMR23900.1 SMC-Scp complex subunit ScpB [Oligoflexia bacterium]
MSDDTQKQTTTDAKDNVILDHSEADLENKVVAIETHAQDNEKNEPESYQDISDEALDSVLESLLFVSEKPVQKKNIHEILREINPEQIDSRLEALCEKHTGAGFELIKINQGYQFRTHPNNSEYLLRLHEAKPVRLSRGNLETLAIVAYRQPITRPEVDEIRGVDSGHMLRTLLDRNLIKILGKREEAGNPLIYGTTADFLEFFQLDNLSDLPSLTEYTELGEESLEKLEKLLPKSVSAEEVVENSIEDHHSQTSSDDPNTNEVSPESSEINTHEL